MGPNLGNLKSVRPDLVQQYFKNIQRKAASGRSSDYDFVDVNLCSINSVYSFVITGYCLHLNLLVIKLLIVKWQFKRLLQRKRHVSVR